MAQKYWSTCNLRCGLKKTFKPGEEVPCDAKLGAQLLKSGQVTTDPKKAEKLRRLEEEKAEEEAKASAEDDTEEADEEGDEGEEQEETGPAPKEKKPAAKKSPGKKAKKK